MRQDMVNIYTYLPAKELHSRLIKFPEEFVGIMAMALKDSMLELAERDQEAGLDRMEGAEGDEEIGTIIISNIRNLNLTDADKLVCIKGLVVRATPVFPEMQQAFFRRLACSHTMQVDFGRGKNKEPARCPRDVCSTVSSMSLIHDRSTYFDRRVIRLQEIPDSVPDGQTPHTASLSVCDELVDVAKPGDRVVVTGVFRTTPVRVNPRQRSLKSLFKAYVDLVHDEIGADGTLGMDKTTREGTSDRVPGVGGVGDVEGDDHQMCDGLRGQPDNKTRRYDRQLRGQSALENSHILVIAGSATSTPILKNLVLPGIGLTILDHTNVTPEGAGNNSFLEGPSSIGKLRAEEAVRLLLELNESMDGRADQRDIAQVLENDPSYITSFTHVIARNLHPTLLGRLSNLPCSDSLIVVNSAGFLAEFTIQFHEHDSKLLNMACFRDLLIKSNGQLLKAMPKQRRRSDSDQQRYARAPAPSRFSSSIFCFIAMIEALKAFFPHTFGEDCHHTATQDVGGTNTMPAGKFPPQLRENKQNRPFADGKPITQATYGSMCLYLLIRVYDIQLGCKDGRGGIVDEGRRFYDGLVKKERTRIEQRKTVPESPSRVSGLSAKARGKQKADPEPEDWGWLLSVDLLPDSCREAVGLCKSLLRLQPARGEERAGPRPGRRKLWQRNNQSNEEQFSELRYSPDVLYSHANTARAATQVSENLLDKHSEVLGVALKAHIGDASLSTTFGRSTTCGARVLNDYLPPDSSQSRPHLHQNPQEIYRTLAQVNGQCPLAMRGDEVRRAEWALKWMGSGRCWRWEEAAEYTTDLTADTQEDAGIPRRNYAWERSGGNGRLAGVGSLVSLCYNLSRATRVVLALFLAHLATFTLAIHLLCVVNTLDREGWTA
ncbi:MCM DNA helicase complex subunit [Marasmius sp. AFHP31]|nr:MCM DNA helicase complex subunit [Marasmius sp. AFHP31]